MNKRIKIKEYAVGLTIYQNEHDYYITGYPNQMFTVRQWDSAYDFENFVKKHFDYTDIQFDSETCQFFAYAHTEKQAILLCDNIEEHFTKVREMLN